MRVFLTGATGFIGQALVRALRRRGWCVDTLVRDPQAPAARWLEAQGCRLVEGDVLQREGLAAAMAGADVVIHNAGVYEFGTTAAAAARMQAVNVEGTRHVLGAALEARVTRTVYVSTVFALGDSGPGQADETRQHGGRYVSAYEKSKAQAHEAALQMRARGLPLVIAMPNSVVGANDHATWGYFLRLHLMGLMPPISFGRDMRLAPVDVNALAEGLCLAAERADPGQDYLFCGPTQTVGDIFGHFARHPGGMRPRLWLPRWLMRLQFACFAPLLRALGLPAFFSPEVVDVTRVNLDYSSAKARRDLGWQHPQPGPMWDAIVAAERRLLSARQGWRQRLRPLSLVA